MRKLNMDEVIANSFKDYHTKGFDYICLKRTPTLTEKVYFFDGNVSALPEVVNPHDHRYDFGTICLAGEVENIWYREGQGKPYQTFDYRTPLNGGDGFHWSGETLLAEQARMKCGAGSAYVMSFFELHTIRMVQPETVLFLTQWEDKVRPGRSTRTFTQDREPPSLSGLYSKPTADDVIAKLSRLSERTPLFNMPVFE